MVIEPKAVALRLSLFLWLDSSRIVIGVRTVLRGLTTVSVTVIRHGVHSYEMQDDAMTRHGEKYV